MTMLVLLYQHTFFFLTMCVAHSTQEASLAPEMKACETFYSLKEAK